MLFSQRFSLAACAVVILALCSSPLPGKTKKASADKDLAAAMAAENAGDFDSAFDYIQKALARKPGDMAVQLESHRIRFEAGAFHVHHASITRNSGKLKEALAEFEQAFAIDPSSDIAQQEIRRTKAMIDRNEKSPAASQEEDARKELSLTPADLERKRQSDKISLMLPVPELKPLSAEPIKLKMTNKPKVLFDTVGKLAGINVIFDPDYETQNTIRQQTVELENASLQEALDDLGVLTKSYWKPLSPNTIFVTMDNRQKRQEYEEQVVKVFYLQNMTQQAELNEAVTLLRTVADIQKVFTSTPMNAIVIRAEADKIPLAEKLIAAIDKPKSEVIVDVMVMEVNSNYMRNLAAAIGGGSGISSSLSFTPRTSLTGQATTTTTTPAAGTTNGTTITTAGTTTNNTLLLPNIRKISTADYTISNVPGAMIEAVLSDSGTKVLQSPQMRALENFKATLRVGEKVPTATGSFQPGVGGVGINPLVNTQFTYLDVGVNMDLTPRVNSATDVSMHLSVEVSQVSSYVNIGGISQPVIGQRKIELDLRMRDGEMNIIGGLMKDEDDKSVGGIPGLSNIPILNRLFSNETITRSKQELLITLVPHIVRGPDITEADLRDVATGNANSYKLNYATKKPVSGQTPQGQVTTPSTTGPALPTPPPTAPATPVPQPAPPQVTMPASGPVAASFSPPQLDIDLASAVPVSVQVQNVSDLSAVQAAIKFDPKILKLNNLITGELIRRNGPDLVPSRNVMGDTGDATVSIARDPSSGGISGSGVLVTFVFQAVGRGTTTVTMPNLTLTGSVGQPIPTTLPTLSVRVK